MTDTNKQALEALDKLKNYLFANAPSHHRFTEISIIRAALQQPPSQGWQPIETAPKDGTPIDVWAIRKHEHGEQDERRLPNVTWGKICNTLTGDIYEGWQGLEDLYAEIIPTHWMPLPQPPKNEDE